MEVQKIHPAEEYLRNEKNPTSLYVRISGERRRLFINRSDGEGVIGIIAKGKRKRGYVFNAWSSIEKVYLHIPADTRSAFPVISVQSPVSIQCCWQS